MGLYSFASLDKDALLSQGSKNKTKIDKWLIDLDADAQFNVSSYIDCFMSENLIRECIKDKRISFYH
jgi:hypothetical protein